MEQSRESLLSQSMVKAEGRVLHSTTFVRAASLFQSNAQPEH